MCVCDGTAGRRGRLLRAGSRVAGLPLSRVRKRARAVLKDEVGEAGRW